jgi:hypothetical protein
MTAPHATSRNVTRSPSLTSAIFWQLTLLLLVELHVAIVSQLMPCVQSHFKNALFVYVTVTVDPDPPLISKPRGSSALTVSGDGHCFGLQLGVETGPCKQHVDLLGDVANALSGLAVDPLGHAKVWLPLVLTSVSVQVGRQQSWWQALRVWPRGFAIVPGGHTQPAHVAGGLGPGLGLGLGLGLGSGLGRGI